MSNTLDDIISEFESLQKQIQSKPTDLECKIDHEIFFDKNDIIKDICEVESDIPQIINLDQFQEIIKNDANQKEDDINSIINCIFKSTDNQDDNIESICEDIDDKVKFLEKNILVKSYFDEFLYNTRFLYNYHKSRVKYYNMKNYNIDILMVSVPVRILNMTNTIGSNLNRFSSNIRINYNKNWLKSYIIFDYIFSFDNFDEDTNDLYNKKIFSGYSDINFIVNQNKVKSNPTGTLYNDFYSKLEDPINNFFTLQERGLTDDIKYAEKIKSELTDKEFVEYENSGSMYYIQNIKKYNEFYDDLDNKIDNRINEYFKSNIQPKIDEIDVLLDSLAKYEIKYLKDFGFKGDSIPNTIKKSIEFIRRYDILLESSNKIDYNIKSTNHSLKSDNIKSDFITKCECIKEIPETYIVEPVINLVDSFTRIKQTDPTPYKHCYWVQFAKLATQFGLLPFPDMQNPRSMRYWSVGLKIPTPSGLINIPLPTIWIPIITISSAFGILVLFIGQSGIIPSPFLLWVSNDGTKKFIVTLRGTSDVFGFKSDDENDYPNKSFMIPLISTIKNIKNPTLEDIIKIELDNNKRIGDIDIKYEFDNIKKLILNYIDKINFEESVNISFNNETIKNYLNDKIDSINLPSVTIPKNVDKFKEISNIESILNELKSMLDISGNIIDIDKYINLKHIILDNINSLMIDSEINDYILKFPQDIRFNELSVDQFNNFKKFIKLCIEKVIFNINSNTIYSDGVFDDLSDTLLRVDVFQCETILDIRVDDSFIKLKQVASAIYFLVDALDLDKINSILGSLSLKRSQLISFVDNILRSFIPDLYLPKDFEISFDNLAAKLIKVILPTMDLKKDFGFPKFNPIVLDLNTIKGVLKDYIDYNIDFSKQISANELKQMLVSMTNVFFDSGNDFLRNIEKSINSMIKILNILNSIKNMKVEFNILDFASNQVEVLKKVAEALKCVTNPSCGDNKGLSDIDLVTLALAILVLKKMGALNYIIVASACAFGGNAIKRSVRMLHPLVIADDLPPYERLTLDNFLFCLFLDDFCKTAKKFSGFQENFI